MSEILDAATGLGDTMLMITEHPQGAGPLVGRQLRYLVESDHGLLGGLAFAASAVHLADRDAWIGWDAEQRRAHSQYIVGLNRFLIRPGVQCRDLASKVLSMGLEAMTQDFEKRYNCKPLLVETFVESGTGTCFRAANWLYVGLMKGRGRQDNHREPTRNIKDIYVFVLDQNFREDMGVSPKEVPGPLELTDGLDADQWSQNEFGGAPLGDVRLSKRLVRSAKELRRPSGKVPIEEKKTFDWIEHHRDLVEVKRQLPDTRVIHACDREADVFELFDEQRLSSSVELLVRAKHDRNIDSENGKLFATVAAQEVLGRVEITVPRQSARPKKSKQKVRAKRDERKAVLELRAMSVQIRPSGAHDGKQPIDVWVVHAFEKHPPANDDPVEWFLLTTIAATCFDDAYNCLRWYKLRRRIEDLHRVLKTGCRIEDLAHETAERLRRAIAINMVIAWRIMLMTLLGRETPNLPAEILFSELELRVLAAFKKNLNPPCCVFDAVQLVARLGGYLGRKNDPPPGHQTLWKGYGKLRDMCYGVWLVDYGELSAE